MKEVIWFYKHRRENNCKIFLKEQDVDLIHVTDDGEK
jgi:hypothetical protein